MEKTIIAGIFLIPNCCSASFCFLINFDFMTTHSSATILHISGPNFGNQIFTKRSGSPVVIVRLSTSIECKSDCFLPFWRVLSSF